MSNLSYDQIIFKASHNSYDRDESLSEQLTFNNNTPSDGGCMAIELDIWRHSSAYIPDESISDNYFTVAHTTPGNKKLSGYLNQILIWHNNNHNHNPVLIYLDIKSSKNGYNNFHNEIDTYLKCYFSENIIFKPGKLFTDPNKSLCENVVNNGWPEINSPDMRNKFIFCLSGNKDWKTEYANTDLKERYCFSDQSKSDNDPNVKPPTNGNFVFFNFHIYNKHKDVWMKTIPPFTDKRLITRTYLSNSETNWNNCIKANVSAIATDKINNHKWAKVSNNNIYREKTGITVKASSKRERTVSVV